MSRNDLQVVLLTPNQKTLKNKTEKAFSSSLSKLLKVGKSNAWMLCQRSSYTETTPLLRQQQCYCNKLKQLD